MSKADSGPEPVRPGRERLVEGYIPYDVPLSGGVRARLVLPALLSASDAEHLCDLIRAVAFPDDTVKAWPDGTHG